MVFVELHKTLVRARSYDVIICHHEQVPRPTALLDPFPAETSPLPGPLGLFCIPSSS
jgi:hypothetical protein